MRKYHMSGVEHVHMMRRVPRSYDMTRTHIMHQGVNKHVDVVLRCSPKHFKKKKVPVSIVKSEKKHEVVHIRANASKGYVAVRKVTNEKYETDRRKVVTAYEMTYGKPSATGKVLIRDMKSQLAAMARKSADYINEQLPAGPTVTVAPHPVPCRNVPQEQMPAVTQQAEPPLPPFPDVPDSSAPSAAELSPEVDEILKKGGYKRPKQPAANPYASEYLQQASDQEFRSLMESLEHSLDEACSKYAVTQPDDTEVEHEEAYETSPLSSEPVGEAQGDAGSYAAPGDAWWVPASEVPDDEEAFRPALDFRNRGEHYIPHDDLFDRDFGSENDDLPPAVEPEDEGQFDLSRFFSDDEFNAPPSDIRYEDEEDEQTFDLPQNSLPDYPEADSESDDDVMMPAFYSDEEEEVPFPSFPDDNAYAEPTADAPNADNAVPLPDDFYVEGSDVPPDNGYAADPDLAQNDFYGDDTVPASDDFYVDDTGLTADVPDNEEMAPPTIFPDDEEEDAMPMIFPDEEDEYLPPPSYPEDEGGYSPAPVSPDRNEVWEDGDYATRIEPTDARPTETFFSRTGGQIKKAIGVIRGSGSQDSSDTHKADSRRRNEAEEPHNADVEITYSDHNG